MVNPRNNDGSTLLLINGYLPTNNYSKTHCTDEFRNTVDELDILIEANNSVDHIIFAGDLNVDSSKPDAHFRYLYNMLSSHNMSNCWSND